MKIKFIGATETVTGSKHLVITESGKHILLDCGLYQGMGKETDAMNRNWDLDASQIEAVILSHGHIDHCGNLPGLVKQGFQGKIYATSATKDVCNILLQDSAHIHESDAAFLNKRIRNSDEEISPLYTLADVEKCMGLFETVAFDTDTRINEEISFYFSENGHIIGSGAINITAKENNKVTRLVFTGDIGRYGDPLLKSPAVFQQADYIICESTYGDKLHGSSDDVEKRLLDIVTETCVSKNGKLIIPAFSLGRTQEILFVLDKLANKKMLPEISIYVDSPMSVKATSIVREHSESYNAELQAYIKQDPDPFGFPNLTYIEDGSESRQLNEMQEPCVIISASGMADAGRVQHHLCYTVADEKNTVLLTGYCAPDSLGGKLMRGEEQVRILGYLFDVAAGIESIHSLSAHGDYNDMIRFLSCQHKSTVKKIFLVHGEAETKSVFSDKLLAEGYNEVVIPAKGEVFELE
ncbi:MBL fold metallo-hydrolase [Sphingobacteriaceae bacterium]|nr:MBL fold metallo-hydrolase [Sphingobacteriaceae bacterium]